jgi:hypothetical protein
VIGAVYQIGDVDGGGHRRDPADMLGDDLVEFVSHHRAHGMLTGDATEPAWNGYLLSVACSCGVVFERWVTPGEAVRELVYSPLLALPG